MDNVQKTLLQIITHHRQNPLDFKIVSISYFRAHVQNLLNILETFSFKIWYLIA
jgi:hypothetical protein